MINTRRPPNAGHFGLRLAGHVSNFFIWRNQRNQQHGVSPCADHEDRRRGEGLPTQFRTRYEIITCPRRRSPHRIRSAPARLSSRRWPGAWAGSGSAHSEATSRKTDPVSNCCRLDPAEKTAHAGIMSKRTKRDRFPTRWLSCGGCRCRAHALAIAGTDDRAGAERILVLERASRT